MKKTLLLLFIISGLYTAKAQHGSQLITVTDMTRIKQAGTASLSHNGKQVVFTVLSVEPDEAAKGEYVYRTQIWIVPADGSAPARALTSSTTSSSQPVWSANDEQIAFVRSVKSKSQIFLLSLNGGEPTQLTKEPRGASYGAYDRTMLTEQCTRFGVAYPMSRQHINVKVLFSDVYKLGKGIGMPGALRMLNLPLEGTHHRGIDDAKNIAKILYRLLLD